MAESLTAPTGAAAACIAGFMARTLLLSRVVLWLAVAEPAPEGNAVEHLKSQLEALSAFTAELDRRLADAGVDGVDGALHVYRRVKDALDGIQLAEVERTLADVAALTRELEEIARRLETLRRLKGLLGG